MAALVTTPRVRPIEGIGGVAATAHDARFLVVPAMIAVAWLVVVIAQGTGHAAALHHHALIDGRPPVWVTLPTFLVAWQVMVAAMMLPASLPAIHIFQTEPRARTRPSLALAAFLGSYAVVWAVFGLVAFTGDFVLHLVVDATPWLSARGWLLEAGVLALAGGYQFVPFKRLSLAVCRHPGDQAPTAPLAGQGGAAGLGLRDGLRHGLACLGSSWALMLVMFAAGFASAVAMAGLTALMVYEAAGRHGHRAASAAGIVLLLAALTALSGPLS